MGKCGLAHGWRFVASWGMLESDLIPARERGSQCLLVALHGLGDSMEGYRWLPEMLALPWLNYLLVNAPDEYYGGFSWYDFAVDPGPGVTRSRQLLFALLDAQRETGFATEQTLMFGFSQGCLMVMEMGLHYGHHFAGIVGVSGYTHEPAKAVAALSPTALGQHFLLTHGTQDPLIPIGPVRTQVALLTGAGLDIEWHEFVKEHTIAGEEELDVIRQFIRKRFNRV
jgi:phospholipase/carboxylesterase